MNEILNDQWLAWHSYPKIYALGHRDARNIFVGAYQIEEKIDGSQISFGVFNGELRIKGKNAQINLENPEKMFGLAVEVIKSLQDKLTEGYVYRGEYLRERKHNVITYARVPNNHIILFDVSDGLQSFGECAHRQAEATRLGFEVVPTFLSTVNMEGVSPITKEELDKLMDKESILGGSKVEGYVFKNYAQRNEGMPTFCKYVSEAFKEAHKLDWKKENPAGKDILVLLTSAFRTNARWEKAIQHLRDEGKLEGSPKDIGILMKEVQRDTKEECADLIKDHLFQWAWPHIQRGIVGGLPEWYNDKISENVIGE